MKTFIMSTLWSLLALIWIETLAANLVLRGDIAPTIMAAIVFGLGVILYYAEGLELAVADLRDKDAAQIAEPRTRAVLAEIQGKSNFFFAVRQVFVVGIISFMSLTLSYDALYFWPLGWVHDNPAKFSFGLGFVSLSVLWFFQVVPKRLAIINSERFLGQALFVWPMVKLVGHLGLVAPVEPIVAVARKLFGFESERRLGLSLHTYYAQSLHRYGVAIDSVGVHAHVQADGSVRLRKRFVLLHSHGLVDQFGGTVEPGFSGVSRITQMTATALYLGTMPPREDFREVYDALDRLAERGSIALTTLGVPEGVLSADLLPKVPHECPVYLDEGPRATSAGWSIRLSMPLPEALQAMTASEGPALAVLVCEVEANCSAGVFAASGQDFWIERFNLPCRRFTLRVTADDASGVLPVLRQTTVGLNDLSWPFPAEQSRVEGALVPDVTGVVKSIEFPAQGAVYRTAVDFLRVTPPIESIRTIAETDALKPAMTGAETSGNGGHQLPGSDLRPQPNLVEVE